MYSSWECTQKLLEGPIFSVSKTDVQLPGKKLIKDRWVVEHKGACVIIPKLNDRLLLVRQYRYCVDEYLLEFPAGKLEKGENPIESASRELAEEVGYRSENMLELGFIYPTPGFCTEKLFVFFADTLSEYRLPMDEDEDIEVLPMTVSEIELAIEQGKIRDAKTIASFFQARLKKLI